MGRVVWNLESFVSKLLFYYCGDLHCTLMSAYPDDNMTSCQLLMGMASGLSAFNLEEEIMLMLIFS